MKLTTRELSVIIAEELRSVLGEEASPCFLDKLERTFSTENPDNWTQAADVILSLADEQPECKDAWGSLLFNAIFNAMDIQKALWDEHDGHSAERDAWIDATDVMSNALDELKGIERKEEEEWSHDHDMPFQEGKNSDEALSKDVYYWSARAQHEKLNVDHATEILFSVDPDEEERIKEKAMPLAVSGIKNGLKGTLDSAKQSMTRNTLDQYGMQIRKDDPEDEQEWTRKQIAAIESDYEQDFKSLYQMLEAFDGTQESLDKFKEATEALEDKYTASRDVGFYYTGAILGYGIAVAPRTDIGIGYGYTAFVEWETAVADAAKYYEKGLGILALIDNELGLEPRKLFRLAGLEL